MIVAADGQTVLSSETWASRGASCMYQAVIDHEERHCREGYWHGDQPKGSSCAP